MEYYNDLICFSLNTEVLDKLTNYIENDNFKIESGGIIIDPAEKQITATDLTESQAKDKCTAVTYKRSAYGHQEIMDNLWEESHYIKTYLVEWHTHNQRIPLPSLIDQRNRMKILKRKQNSECFFS